MSKIKKDLVQVFISGGTGGEECNLHIGNAEFGGIKNTIFWSDYEPIAFRFDTGTIILITDKYNRFISRTQNLIKEYTPSELLIETTEYEKEFTIDMFIIELKNKQSLITQ
jgi:hypothetical protein